ncbi:hypothetical protein, partial [Rhizobium leguminosarum]|uniref:hypothetical protein n=1 Tax=Rhizobium leguminosarum TaxID=384 RepID=UPI003F989FDB
PFSSVAQPDVTASIAAIVEAAERSDLVFVFAENEKSRHGEGNDRDTLKLTRPAGIERQRLALIAQQHDRLRRDVARQRMMRLEIRRRAAPLA